MNWRVADVVIPPYQYSTTYNTLPLLHLYLYVNLQCLQCTYEYTLLVCICRCIR